MYSVPLRTVYSGCAFSRDYFNLHAFWPALIVRGITAREFSTGICARRCNDRDELELIWGIRIPRFFVIAKRVYLVVILSLSCV